jgi:hypothetical protein
LAQKIFCSSLISSGRQNADQSGAIKISCCVQAQPDAEDGLLSDKKSCMHHSLAENLGLTIFLNKKQPVDWNQRNRT